MGCKRQCSPRQSQHEILRTGNLEALCWQVGVLLQLPLTPLNQSLLLLWQKTQWDMNPWFFYNKLVNNILTGRLPLQNYHVMVSTSCSPTVSVRPTLVWPAGQSAVHPNIGIRDSQITQGRRDLGMSPSSLLACSMKSEQAVQGHTQGTNTLWDGNCTALLAGFKLSTAPPSEPKSPIGYQHTWWSKHPDLIFQLGHKHIVGDTAVITQVWVSDIHCSPLISNHFITESSLVKHGLPLVNPFQQCQMPSSSPKHSQQQPQRDTDLSVPTTELQEQLCSGSWIYSFPPWEGYLSFTIWKKSDPWFRVVEPAVQVASGCVGQLVSLCFSYSSHSTSNQLTKTDRCTQSSMWNSSSSTSTAKSFSPSSLHMKKMVKYLSPFQV